MVVALLSILAALFLGYGAVEEFIVRGVRGGEVQPLVAGLAGIVVSLLLLAAGVALSRRRPARRLVLLAGAASVLFHVYAALPPHRNVGILVLLVGVGFGFVLLGYALGPKDRQAQTA